MRFLRWQELPVERGVNSMPDALFVCTGAGLLALAAGAALDMALGDPERPTHPVVLMGAAVAWGDKFFRSLTSLSPKIQGGLMALFLTAAAYGAAALILKAALAINLYCWSAAASIMIFYGLALRTLCREVGSVAEALSEHGLEPARRQISRLVSRKTSDLQEPQVASAAIETAAENLVDGVISPFFYAALGGPALMAAFKMISTMDSMIGYKTEDYIQFGRAAARMDDAANYLPARISLVFIALAAFILFGRKRAASVIPAALSQGRFHSSPNSGLPEAAFAAALGVKIGGPCTYFGKRIEGHWYNQEAPDPGPDDVRQSISLLMLSSVLFYVTVLLLGLLCFLAGLVP